MAYNPLINMGGLANGLATLDNGGKVPVAQLPNSVMEYQGAWDASTNSPTLVDGTGNAGDVYRVSVAGTQNLGSGAQAFLVGDFVIYSGTIWQKSPGADGVISVNGAQGAVTVNAINQLTGDVTAGPASGSASAVTTVASVGGSSASNVNAATVLANAATSANTASAIVKRDGSGNFSAGTITANLTGNASGSAASFTGSLVGDVTGTQGATVVSSVGGSTAANVNTATALVNTAQSGNKVLASPANGSSGAPAFRALVAADVPFTAPTVSSVTTAAHSGGFPANGTGTYTTPAGVRYIRVRMVGGGAGGSGSGTASAGTSGNGNSTSFGTSLLVAGGGFNSAPAASAGVPATSGNGGTTLTVNSPAVAIVAQIGGNGDMGQTNPAAVGSFLAGGIGGEAAFFSGGGMSGRNATGSGAGGGGGSGNNIASIFTGGGGGSGAYIEAFISAPSATYTYTIGTGGSGGTAGTSGTAGGAGAGGQIIIEEYY